MFKSVIRFFVLRHRKQRNYGLSRELSGSRAASTAERLIGTGALQSSRMTGNPLARAEQ